MNERHRCKANQIRQLMYRYVSENVHMSTLRLRHSKTIKVIDAIFGMIVQYIMMSTVANFEINSSMLSIKKGSLSENRDIEKCVQLQQI